MYLSLYIYLIISMCACYSRLKIWYAKNVLIKQQIYFLVFLGVCISSLTRYKQGRFAINTHQIYIFIISNCLAVLTGNLRYISPNIPSSSNVSLRAWVHKISNKYYAFLYQLTKSHSPAVVASRNLWKNRIVAMECIALIYCEG